MISITTFNYGETSLEQLFKDALAILNENHKIHDKDGIKVNVTEVPDPSNDDETEDMDTNQYNWEFKDYEYLRIFIEQVIIKLVPVQVAHSSGDDDYFDYLPNLIIETHDFLKSLTEALPYKKLSEIALQPYPKVWKVCYEVGKLISTIKMAVFIFNAILEANSKYRRGNDPGEGYYYDLGEDHKLPLYQ